MNEGDQSVAEAPAKVKRTKTFDFRQPKTLERNQLKALEIVFESFVRPGGSVLGANLRVPCKLEISVVDQISWDDLVSTHTGPSSVTVFNLAPLPPRAILHLPAELALLIVDLRMGGNGAELPEPRNPTDIEQVITATVLVELLGQMCNALGSIADVHIERLHNEQSLQFVQGIPLNEMCVTVKFSVQVGELDESEMLLILPFPMLRPIIDTLANRSAAAFERGNDGFSTAMKDRLFDPEVELKVVFQPTFLTSGQIVDLEPGDVIRMGHRQGEALDVLVDDVKLYRAQPTQVGNRVAVLLVEE